MTHTHKDDRGALSSNEEVSIKSADLSIVVEEVETEGGDGKRLGVLPELQSQFPPLATRPCLVKPEKRQVVTGSCNDFNHARVSSDRRQNCGEIGVSSDTFNLRGVLASIALDQFFEAEGFVFNK